MAIPYKLYVACGCKGIAEKFVQQNFGDDVDHFFEQSQQFTRYGVLGPCRRHPSGNCGATLDIKDCDVMITTPDCVTSLQPHTQRRQLQESPHPREIGQVVDRAARQSCLASKRCLNRCRQRRTCEIAERKSSCICRVSRPRRR